MPAHSQRAGSEQTRKTPSLKARVRLTAGRMSRTLFSMLPDRAVVMLHEASALVRPIDYDGEPILLQVDSDIEVNTRLNSCSKEPEMLSWIRGTFRRGDTLFDVGANVGAYSLVAVTEWRGGVSAVAFEPSAINYAKLCRNLALNRYGKEVCALPVALAEQSGLVPFHYSDLAAGAALHRLGGPGEGAVFSQPVIAMPLDDAIKTYGLAQPDHLKVDVDGGETGVFRGAAETLRGPKLRSVLVELEQETPAWDEISTVLGAAGFTLDAQYPCVRGTRDPQLARLQNCLFVRR